MKDYKHFPFDEEILDAMIKYNIDKPAKEQFTLVDAHIISLVHSYEYSGQTFFASNKYLAEKCFTTQATIQKSINKLLAYGFINKKVFCIEGRKQRILTYNEQAVEEFKLAAPHAP